MINKYKIAILLSTFNSEKYLREQIDSIINQTCKEWALYIRDDGSNDSTMEIIKAYCHQYTNIFFIQDEIINKGPRDSFMYLMKEVESDYYMFCDHDDVWMPQKIEFTLNKIWKYKEYNNSTPIVIHTDLVVVNENLKPCHPSFWKFNHTSPKYKSFAFHCAYNNLTGCTMLFNRMTRDLSLPIPKGMYMHDKWVALVVSFHKGIIDYIKAPTILYRQHANNTLGAREAPSFLVQLRNLKVIMQKNKNQYKAVCYLRKMPFLFFLINKSFFYLKLKFQIL